MFCPKCTGVSLLGISQINAKLDMTTRVLRTGKIVNTPGVVRSLDSSLSAISSLYCPSCGRNHQIQDALLRCEVSGAYLPMKDLVTVVVESVMESKGTAGNTLIECGRSFVVDKSLADKFIGTLKVDPSKVKLVNLSL